MNDVQGNNSSIGRQGALADEIVLLDNSMQAWLYDAVTDSSEHRCIECSIDYYMPAMFIKYSTLLHSMIRKFIAGIK